MGPAPLLSGEKKRRHEPQNVQVQLKRKARGTKQEKKRAKRGKEEKRKIRKAREHDTSYRTLATRNYKLRLP